ncbi:hypothetical protein HOP50_09g57080 [Chloropicon primus]|uniref:PA14 domain-containing protein n=2 Tax=Chloropicon primus TaxID=1764295 RepID=A0A5B8MRF9_9CHLO|nr:hypothetical protein A3770_09p56870 [Chloropicon primus]UPR02382.1 hypothetical protein HOP50_09g57080 [Chloropicon primus]|eukprot:QDZ23169.1 hypothetical protein A3770_09p56870 [Chloropicon primus]
MARTCLLALLAVAGIVGASWAQQQQEGCTVMDLIQRREDLTLVTKAIVAAGFEETLLSPGPLRFFAPDDSAFLRLNEKYAGDSASAVLDLDLYDLMRSHLLLEGGRAAAVGGSAEQDILGGARVLDRVGACNGELAVVDRVLIPEIRGGEQRRGGEGTLDAGAPAEACAPGECCDLQPPGDFSCEEQTGWGKCWEDWMVVGGYCRQSCGRCSFQSMVDPTIGESNATRVVNDGILYQQWWYMGSSNRLSSLDGSRFMREEPDVDLVIEDGEFYAPEPYKGYPESASRMGGYFCAPSSGNYTFYLSSDDSAWLKIMDDKDVRIMKTLGKDPFEYISTEVPPMIWIDGFKRESEWKDPLGPKAMKKGEVTYLEVQQKNGWGRGHVNLGVVLPSGDFIQPIPSYFFHKNCDV